MKSDVEFFEARGFGNDLGLGKNACLIVIDFVEGFTNESMPMGYNLDKQIENTNRLIKAARSSNIPVIFTSISYNNTRLEKDLLWKEKMQGLKTLIAGTNLVRVDPRLDYCKEEDDLIYKKFASAFFGTNLVSILNTGNIDTLIVAGCTTSGCVRATVVDAVQYGYRSITVTDAVGDRSEKSHYQSLFDIEQKYGDLSTTEELLEKLSTKIK
ncbi:isochorismatase family protein [Niallia sp. JL1B1071]|uniref:isochorismatase family protein n=1 Tax=Niallia tiangongensis TaxID=3237105 RepID=UPI0037DD6045